MSTPPSITVIPPEPHGESLHGVRGTVPIPDEKAGFWKNWRAFAGPALLVSVGYMDPGNWATDLAAGAEFKYGLLWVVAMSSMMAIILQICAAKLGVVTGKDLARASRDFMPKWTRVPNWLCTELAIAACDLAEVLGSAVAIHLLTGTLHQYWPAIPEVSILIGVIITAFDVLLLMALQNFGFRKIEAFILVLVATIAGCYFMEIIIFGHAHREAAAIGSALLQPGFPPDGQGSRIRSLSLAIGIIGATVMPHNLYLHSALVQTRQLQKNESVMRRAIKFNAIDSVLALSLAFFVNAAILILAAITFFGKPGLTYMSGGQEVPVGDDWIQGAYHTLRDLLGVTGAGVLFAISLLASGQSSTITGTLAGQIVMEGFMSWNIRPWIRRLVTRLIAIVPAVVVIGIAGESKVTSLLTLSQIILGLQLPFAMIPLMIFTSRRNIMGNFVNGPFLKITGWTAVTLITLLDLYVIFDLIRGAVSGGGD